MWFVVFLGLRVAVGLSGNVTSGFFPLVLCSCCCSWACWVRVRLSGLLGFASSWGCRFLGIAGCWDFWLCLYFVSLGGLCLLLAVEG